MNRIIACLLGLFIVISCNNASSKKNNAETGNSREVKNDSLDKVALQLLFGKINKLPNSGIKNDEIFIGDTSIRVKLTLEQEAQQNGKWIYAANVGTFYKAGAEMPINVGSIGIGSTRNEAINVCIEEWFAVFGLPFTNMLNNDTGVSIQGMRIFPGLMGIRGKLPENTWLKGDGETTEKIISPMLEQIKMEKGEIVPVDIKLMIGAGGVSDGECRINNIVSEQLLANLKRLPWPSSNEGYLYKQFYLIKKSDR